MNIYEVLLFSNLRQKVSCGAICLYCPGDVDRSDRPRMSGHGPGDKAGMLLVDDEGAALKDVVVVFVYESDCLFHEKNGTRVLPYRIIIAC